MFLLLYLLSYLTVVSAGFHSLFALATYIVGDTQFPEFSVVLMLDDVQILYYDSATWKAVFRSHRDSKYYDEEQRDAAVHVHQRLAGCELLNSDKPGLLQTWDAFDGQNVEEFTFDIEKHDIKMKKPWMIMWSQFEHLKVKLMYENVYHPVCIKTLRRYLEMEKNNVMRKVKPRVRLVKKMLTDSHGLKISCLATGFYPRHINLTLFRDGQFVDDNQITGGEILPNGDGTYQMRKSLVISEEELHEGHEYNCTMKHLNLDNKLDIIFDVAESDPGSFSQSVVFGVLVFICLAALIITALIIWRKRHSAGQGSVSQGEYSPTPSSVQDEYLNIRPLE
ncbi:major histocompatibility complex class I-related gene protein-like isoform X2 [Carassius carassius]|uniref:major histocompatibility complex class I-related gene protein-like isoform X2 n=1 Tax=Carassius carassius TaxID=217509 RepID=UPI002868976E|nr:major histocompatibility complex class I-related gene protein-like isoform X2 [Carassius carassius]